MRIAIGYWWVAVLMASAIIISVSVARIDKAMKERAAQDHDRFEWVFNAASR